MTSPFAHPTIPKISVPYFFMSAPLEILSKHLDQEVGDDVRKDNCENTAGGRDADIKLLKTQRIDQIGQVGGGVPGAARSFRVDLGKNRQQEDRLNHHDDANRKWQARNNAIEK